MSLADEPRLAFVQANGIRLHYAELGAGPAVILCHGFPELWRSWRHQLPALATAGYRAIALDMRGHGRSDAPAEVADYTVLQTVGDVIGLMDALDIPAAALIGHDAGTTTVYHSALMRPDRVRGVLGLSVPFVPRASISRAAAVSAMPHGFYMRWFQEPGIAEADLDANPRETLRRLFFHNSGENPHMPATMVVSEGEGLIANLAAPSGMMGFITDADLDAYAAAYQHSGFRGGLNGYRVLDRNWRLTAPWAGMRMPVPSSYIGGSRDGVLLLPGFRERAEAMDRCVIIDGAGHWIQAERWREVNAGILAFLGTLC